VITGRPKIDVVASFTDVRVMGDGAVIVARIGSGPEAMIGRTVLLTLSEDDLAVLRTRLG
jgi:hypothetical protein